MIQRLLYRVVSGLMFVGALPFLIVLSIVCLKGIRGKEIQDEIEDEFCRGKGYVCGVGE